MFQQHGMSSILNLAPPHENRQLTRNSIAMKHVRLLAITIILHQTTFFLCETTTSSCFEEEIETIIAVKMEGILYWVWISCGRREHFNITIFHLLIPKTFYKTASEAIQLKKLNIQKLSRRQGS